MSDAREPADAEIVYVPSSAMLEADTYTELGELVVEGETFAVRRREEDGSNHYDWISGPNAGYGFSRFSGFEPLSEEEHRAGIRGFLAAINPETGYL